MRRHAKITRAFYDAYNRRDWEALATILGPTVTWFHTARREQIQGPDAVLALLRSSAEAFTEARIDVHALHESGKTVVVEWSYRTARGASARRPIVCDVLELHEGKLTRGTTYGDTLQILLDLGQPAAPIPAAPPAPVIRYAAA